jgi:glutamate synthase domain-containing protein 1
MLKTTFGEDMAEMFPIMQSKQLGVYSVGAHHMRMEELTVLNGSRVLALAPPITFHGMGVATMETR